MLVVLRFRLSMKISYHKSPRRPQNLSLNSHWLSACAAQIKLHRPASCHAQFLARYRRLAPPRHPDRRLRRGHFASMFQPLRDSRSLIDAVCLPLHWTTEVWRRCRPSARILCLHQARSMHWKCIRLNLCPHFPRPLTQLSALTQMLLISRRFRWVLHPDASVTRMTPKLFLSLLHLHFRCRRSAKVKLSTECI